MFRVRSLGIADLNDFGHDADGDFRGGFRLDLPQGWVLVRASGTENYVRIFAEAGSADAARVQQIIELALEFSLLHLKPEGALIVKAFHGSGFSQVVESFKRHFKRVVEIKPKASRKQSSETFLVAKGLK